jgi:hypothetical protein
LHNQKDTPLVTNFFLTSMLDEDCSPFEFPYDLTRINDVLSSVFRTKKPAYPGDKSPGQLALTLLFTPAPKNGFRPSGLVSHYTGSLLNNGGVFVTTAQNITWGKALRSVPSQGRIENAAPYSYDPEILHLPLVARGSGAVARGSEPVAPGGGLTGA